jgi:hypothetical protein
VSRAVIVMNERVAAHLGAACARRVADLDYLDQSDGGLDHFFAEALRLELRDLRDVIGVIVGAVKIQ